MRKLSKLSQLLTGVAAVTLGCTGALVLDDGSSPDNPSPSGTTPQVSGTAPGTAPFRRLTKAEYTNTVHDLLQLSSAPTVADNFPPDTESNRSGFVRGGSVSEVDAGRLLEATAELASGLMNRLADVLPCSPLPTTTTEQAACANEFIADFGLRAFRRPLTSAEQADFSAFYEKQRSEVGHDFPDAIRMIVSAMLLSPKFLYRWEVVPEETIKDGALIKFNSYELASRLSYLFWGSMPDAALFTAAATDRLAAPAELEAQARRLVQDPKAERAFADFFLQWLEVGELPDQTKNSGVFPNYSRELAEAMLNETREFVADLMMNGDGRLETLLTSKSTFVNGPLAELYGVSGVSGSDFTGVTLDDTRRAGILTHASFLAKHGTTDESHPVQRGKMLADRVLCFDLPLPPDDIPNPKPPAPNLSTRERFAEHGQNECAKACHDVMDPLGFAFEHYDAIGGYRTMDGGKPVDASGKLLVDGATTTFNDAIELLNVLSTSEDVRECMARQWLRFALRRHEGTGDKASFEVMQKAFAEGSYDMREMLVALVKTQAFTHRTATEGEVLP